MRKGHCKVGFVLSCSQTKIDYFTECDSTSEHILTTRVIVLHDNKPICHCSECNSISVSTLFRRVIVVQDKKVECEKRTP